MKVVTGLREPDYGRVLFRGRDVAEDPSGKRRGSSAATVLGLERGAAADRKAETGVA